MRLMMFAVAALAFTSTSAVAEPWLDPNGRLVFEAPVDWMVAPQPATGFTYAVALGNTSECHVFASPRPATAAATPDILRQASRTLVERTAWTNIVQMLPNIFQGDVRVASQDVDTDTFWPVQIAELRLADGRTVQGAIQFRPGLELWAFCQNFYGSNDRSAFTTVSHSLGTPNDAQLQVDAVRLAAERQEAEEARLQADANRLANGRREYEQNRNPQ